MLPQNHGESSGKQHGKDIGSYSKVGKKGIWITPTPQEFSTLFASYENEKCWFLIRGLRSPKSCHAALHALERTQKRTITLSTNPIKHGKLKGCRTSAHTLLFIGSLFSKMKRLIHVAQSLGSISQTLGLGCPKPC